ncbi:Uu.00g064180.m01.CDS01 [Anthostomella pinea]|uniref:Uu.00g064180.m01.CDS01 n=1 Tax=Anthostomella pinea TaxID=933095 RepID=A0AAI8VTJ2_9PEZI|nr:Uu.00g064180.m01.CDS01 [Anthostomella pinea]
MYALATLTTFLAALALTSATPLSALAEPIPTTELASNQGGFLSCALLLRRLPSTADDGTVEVYNEQGLRMHFVSLAGSEDEAGHCVSWSGPSASFAFAILRKKPTFNRQRMIFSSMTRYYDTGKARKRLSYAPLVSLSDGVKRTVRWTLDQQEKAKHAAAGAMKS